MNSSSQPPCWEPLSPSIAAVEGTSHGAPEHALIQNYICRVWTEGEMHHFEVRGAGGATLAKGHHGERLGSLTHTTWPAAGWWWGAEDDGLERISMLSGRVLSRTLCELAVFNELSRRTARMRASLAARIVDLTTVQPFEVAR